MLLNDRRSGLYIKSLRDNLQGVERLQKVAKIVSTNFLREYNGTFAAGPFNIETQLWESEHPRKDSRLIRKTIGWNVEDTPFNLGLIKYLEIYVVSGDLKLAPGRTRNYSEGNKGHRFR